MCSSGSGDADEGVMPRAPSGVDRTAAARSRRRRGSTGCSGAAASRRATAPLRRPCARNASSAYCEQHGWYLHVPAGVSRPKRVAPRVDERRCRGTSSRGRLPEHVGDLLHEPVVASGLGRLGETLAGDEDVVAPGRHPSSELAPRSRGAAASAGFAPRRSPTAFGTASPSRGSPSGRPRVETSAGSDSGSTPTVPDGRRRRSPASGKGDAGAARGRRAQAESRLRPFARRRLGSRCPRGSTCARGSRACASGGGRLAGRCVSQCLVVGERSRRPVRAERGV